MIDALLPQSGYKILDAPADYVPLSTPARRLLGPPSVMGAGEGYHMPAESEAPVDTVTEVEGITVPAEERKYFEKILKVTDDSLLNNEEVKEKTVLTLILKV
jgi:hypothetical protein